jgi:hypothetical protein
MRAVLWQSFYGPWGGWLRHLDAGRYVVRDVSGDVWVGDAYGRYLLATREMLLEGAY